MFGWSKPTKPPDWLAVISLNKEEAKCELKINHNNEALPFCSEPTYLGEMLDRTLTYRRHLQSLRKKLTPHVAILEAANWLWLGCWRNNVVNSHLSPGTFNRKSTALLSGAEALVCLIDPAINDALRIVAGGLRPTPADNHPILTSIQPAELRRKGAQQSLALRPMDPGYLLHSVLTCPSSGNEWHFGMTLPRRAWVRLNYLRTGVGCFRSCLHRWGMATSAACECVAKDQTTDHVVLQCPIHRLSLGLHGLAVLDDKQWRN